MTFRDFNKVVRKDTDNFSEHNFSVISNRDVDNMNDITIVFTEEKKSEFFRDTLTHTNLRENDSNYFKKVGPKEIEINLNNPESVSKFSFDNNMLSTSPIKLHFNSEMDDFLTKHNAVNSIKI